MIDLQLKKNIIFEMAFFLSTESNYLILPQVPKKNDMSFWELFAATTFGGSLGYFIVDTLKEVYKETVISKRNRKNLKYEMILRKRLQIYEELHSKLDAISSFGSSTLTIDKILEIENFKREKSIYIEKKMDGICSRFCDYFKDVLNGETPDIELENSFMKEIIDQFNK